MKSKINLGKETITNTDICIDYKYELLPEKYSVFYDGYEGCFMLGIGQYAIRKYSSKENAKKGLISYIKKNSPEDLIKVDKKYIA